MSYLFRIMNYFEEIVCFITKRYWALALMTFLNKRCHVGAYFDKYTRLDQRVLFYKDERHSKRVLRHYSDKSDLFDDNGKEW